MTQSSAPTKPPTRLAYVPEGYAEWLGDLKLRIHGAQDLRSTFPELKGFSRSNLKYMRAFAEAWPDGDSIGQQPVGQLPWGHNVVLLSKLKGALSPPLQSLPGETTMAAMHGKTRME